VLLGGCGSGGNVKKGDIIILQEDLRERAETQWEDSYTDGFTTIIPKGTKLEVLFTPAPAAQVFECRPVEVNGKKDPEEVEAFFVPEHILNKEGYSSYVFALKKEFVGTKIKKVE
jgi:hypothetical protein